MSSRLNSIFIIATIILCAKDSYLSSNRATKSQQKRARTLNTDSDLDILDEMLLSYDRRALPGSREKNPTVVFCELFIRSFGSINPESMDYEVDLYLRQSWVDKRLQTPNLSRPLDLNDPNLVKKIWKPEVFFVNAKEAEFQFVTVPNVLIRLEPSGNILYMLRLKLRFSCMMDLYRYPMDTQVCAIELASFSKTTDELLLRWSPSKPIILYENLKLPQFQLTNVSTTSCKEKMHIGEYSCLKAEFELQRSLGYHMVQSYLPTVLIVAISWVSFWLDVDAIPARVTLGVTTLLTISSKGIYLLCLFLISMKLGAFTQNNLPPVSYVKAIDVWMGACTTFVFMALLEFTVVNYLWRKGGGGVIISIPQPFPGMQCGDSNSKKEEKEEQKTLKERENHILNLMKSLNAETRECFRIIAVPSICGNIVNNCFDNTTLIINKSGSDLEKIVKRARNIDIFSRFVFPLLFLVFNTLYWIYYLSV